MSTIHHDATAGDLPADAARLLRAVTELADDVTHCRVLLADVLALADHERPGDDDDAAVVLPAHLLAATEHEVHGRPGRSVTAGTIG